ncbi:hypothetical protein Tco_1389721, partial [Tanacetum coccineum]
MGAITLLTKPSGLAQMAIKDNLGEVVTTCERSGFKPRREGFPSGAKNEWGLSPKVKITTTISIFPSEDFPFSQRNVAGESSLGKSRKGFFPQRR